MIDASSGANGLGFGLSFSLTDSFSGPAAQIQNSFSRLTGGAEKMSDNIQNSLQRIYAGAAQMGAAKSLLEPFFAAIKAYGTFESLEKGLTTIMGSMGAARYEMVQLREVAKLPGLGFREAVGGSIQLQSVQMSADMARNALLGFGNAIALIGGSRVELDGVIVQLRQMMSVGKVLSQDLKPVMSRVPQLGMIMKKIFGTSSPDEINKKGISAKVFVEKVTAELLKLPKAGAGIANSLENLGDSMFLALQSIGKPLAPFVNQISDTLTALGEKIEYFADSAIGKLIIKIAAGIAAISAVRLGFAAFQTMLPEVIKKTGLFSPVIGGLTATISGLFKAMTGGFLSVGKSLFDFTKANFGTIALVGALIAIQQLMKGYDSFMALVEGKQGVLTGLNGFLQKMGGYAKAVWEILSSVSDKGFSLSEDTFIALQKLGIADAVLNIGTWIVRLQQIWYGLTDSLKAGWKVLGGVFDWIGEKLDKMGLGIGANLTELDKFKKLGNILGVGIMVALAGIALGFVSAAISGVTAGIAVLIAWLPFTGTVLGIIAAIALLGLAFYGIYLGAMWVAAKVVGFFKWIGSAIWNWSESAYEAGSKFVDNLTAGIKAQWAKLVKWLKDAWASVTDVFYKTFGLDSNVNINSTTPVDPGSFTPYQNTEALNNMSEQRMYIQNAPLQMAAMTGQQPPVIVEKIRDIHTTNIIQVDGRDVRKSINRLDEQDSGR